MGQIEGGWRGGNVVSDGLVLYLDAGSPNSYRQNLDTNWRDISGNNNNATFPSTGETPTYSTTNGGFFLFDGSNDYATLPSGFANFTAGITMELWAFPTTVETPGTSDTILRLSGTSADTIMLTRGTGGGSNSFFNGSIGNTIYGGQIQFNANTWYQWTWRANGTNITTYVNGAQDRNNVDSRLPNNVTRTLNTIGGQTDWFTGRIAILRIYNRALSLTEITQNYNANRARFGL